MANKIPKAKSNKTKSIINGPQKPDNTKGITFSFETLSYTEYFNLDATCNNWTKDLFDMMKNVSTISEEDLILGKYKTYRVHPHGSARPPSELPTNVDLKNLYQIRISTAKGGIHGVFSNNIFYIVWLDPLHNLYPSQNHGGLKKVKAPTTCCKERDEILKKLSEENKKLELQKTELENYIYTHIENESQPN